MHNSRKIISLLVITMMLFATLLISPATGNAAEAMTYQPTEKTSGLIRNPGMGWILYCDAFGQMTNNTFPDINKCVNNPNLFWQSFDNSGATAKATTFYIRAPWSFYEPTAGQYSWNDPNSNYSILMQGALDRGLRIAFRVYVDSQDSYQQATPEYVRLAGAKGYTNTFWTPYVNDQIFLNKLNTFISAFGAKYNNHPKVDFIDAMGLGAWGEGHNMRTDNTQPGNTNSSIMTVAQYYRNAFPNVLLGGQQGGGLASAAESLAQSNKFDILRRDSIGMKQYFTQADKDYYVNRLLTYGIPLFSENGWNYFAHDFAGYMNRNGNPFSNIRDMLVYSLNDAITARANTFDLRVPEDAIEWMNNVDLVDDFIVNGGYRFVPLNITTPSAITSNDYITVQSNWKNTGIGKLPNDRPAWNYKYKVAYSLLNTSTKQPVFTSVTNIDPSVWLKGNNYQYDTPISFGNVPNGSYELAYAIVDTSKGNTPAINLAVTNPATSTGWYPISQVIVSNIQLAAPKQALPTYRFSEDFSSVQGNKQWYYMQGNGSNYTNMTWDANTNKWNGAYQWNSIGVNALIHPDANDTVIAWKAPMAGNIAIKGKVAKQNNSCGDGVRVKIMKNNTQIWPTSGWQTIAANDITGFTPNIPTTVSPNDNIYFVLNQNANTSCDGTRWNPTIEYMPSVNVAPQAVVTTTLGTSAGNISNINNGSITDAWSSGKGITFPGYITLDLGATTKMTSGITLITHYGVGQGITNVDIEYNNGGVWTSAVSQSPISWTTNTDDEEFRNISFSPVLTNKIRVKVNSANMLWNHLALNEIQWWTN
ncbi:hypothetical protein [Paenibacillus sp. CMAA1364]